METSSIIQLLILLIAVVIHELAHGLVAYRFGDPTAKNMGRLTLNPIPHLDPLGSIILPVLLHFTGAGFMIGWAKPVPVNLRYFANPIRDMMWVALAGPLSNITIAVLVASLAKLFMPLVASSALLQAIVVNTIFINVLLAIFNLIPIPPLDGSRILANFLSYQGQDTLRRMEPYGFFIIIALASLGLFEKLLPLFVFPLVKLLL